MERPEPNKMDCPYICPGYKKEQGKKSSEVASVKPKEAGKGPYVPGRVKPPVPTHLPAGAPPTWLPQPTDSTSGDYLGMGPVDPWAPGHMDWSPQAGLTGVRPVVDRYSITRYSTGEWRFHNKFMLDAFPNKRGQQLDDECHAEMEKSFREIKAKGDHSNKMLDKRINDVTHWKRKVAAAKDALMNELELLELDRMKLKTASRILMIPEAISRECLEIRTHRLEPDQVRDNAEQELIREVAIVGEIRRVFNETLVKVETQLAEDKAAKAVIESDWADKLEALREDKMNRSMDTDSTLILQHPGVIRWPDNSTSLEYWLHYCQESINNCDEVRERSEHLRDDLMTVIVKGGQDLKIQCDRTNMYLKESIEAQEGLCKELEATLRENLQKIVNIENLLDYLKASLRELDQKSKLSMTRLHSRNYHRSNVENCRDEAQYAIMDEIKFVREQAEAFKDRVRQAEMVRAQLMKFRGDLEKEIASKPVCMVAGVAVYPAAWSETAVQETCGPTADQYNIGRCHVRWAYLLAVIACLDGIVLAALAFILATRHVRLQPDSGYPPPSLYKGEVNNAYVTDAGSVSGSRKSLALQPVLLMHPHAPLAPLDLDAYSHYSARSAPRAKHGLYANTMHNYQL